MDFKKGGTIAALVLFTTFGGCGVKALNTEVKSLKSKVAVLEAQQGELKENQADLYVRNKVVAKGFGPLELGFYMRLTKEYQDMENYEKSLDSVNECLDLIKSSCEPEPYCGDKYPGNFYVPFLGRGSARNPA